MLIEQLNAGRDVSIDAVLEWDQLVSLDREAIDRMNSGEILENPPIVTDRHVLRLHKKQQGLLYCTVQNWRGEHVSVTPEEVEWNPRAKDAELEYVTHKPAWLANQPPLQGPWYLEELTAYDGMQVSTIACMLPSPVIPDIGISMDIKYTIGVDSLLRVRFFELSTLYSSPKRQERVEITESGVRITVDLPDATHEFQYDANGRLVFHTPDFLHIAEIPPERIDANRIVDEVLKKAAQYDVIPIRDMLRSMVLHA